MFEFKFLWVLLAFGVILNCLQVFECKIIKRAATKKKWPSNTIAYSFDSPFALNKANQEIIASVLKGLEDTLSVNGQKCLEFIPHTNEEDYILFSDGTECSSTVGYTPGINKINLASNICIKTSSILHELMHRLGFDHEHSRPDRNKYIQILKNNIPDAFQLNFEYNQQASMNYDTPYDYYSIMHYNSDALRKEESLQTFLSRYPVMIGDARIKFPRENLSEIDIIQIQRMYNCEERPIQKLNTLNNENVDEIEGIALKFESEVIDLKLDETIGAAYLKRTLLSCGTDHYWPFDYPIVEYDHELYKTVCLKRKPKHSPCKFTLECEGSNLECKKALFRNGVCKDIGNRNKLGTFFRIIGSKIKNLGSKLKKGFRGTVSEIKDTIRKI